MALRHFDSAHGYSTNNGTVTLQMESFGYDVEINTLTTGTAGRFAGTTSRQSNGSSNQYGARIPMPSATGTVRVAIDHFRSSLSAEAGILRIANSIVSANSAVAGINVASVFFGVTQDALGFYKLIKGATTLATSTNAYATVNAHRRVEMEMVISASGSFKLWVGGNLEINYSGNLVGTVTGSPVFYGIGQSNGGISTFIVWDDVNTGDGWTGYMGDFQPVQLLPNGVGSSSQSTVTGAATRHEAVDDTFRNGATDYVTLTNGQKDLYAYPDVGVAGPVHSVVLQPAANLSGTGASRLRCHAKSGAAEAQSGLSAYLETLGNVYGSLPITASFPTDPDTGIAWTVAGVNAAEFGVSATL